jgi:hypothetical protein
MRERGREEHFSPEARQQMGLPPIHAHRDGDEPPLWFGVS